MSIRGRVQGVGYRAWTAETAARANLEGWVRNRRDGTVEAVFSGPDEAVAAMLEACERGPLGARVEAVYVLPDAGEDLLALCHAGDRFSMLATA